jgi:hypothetical protein
LAPELRAELAKALGVEVREGDERQKAEVGVSSAGVLSLKAVCVRLVFPVGYQKRARQKAEHTDADWFRALVLKSLIWQHTVHRFMAVLRNGRS